MQKHQENNTEKILLDNNMPLDPSDTTQKEALDRGQRISADWIGSSIKKDLPKIIREESPVDDSQNVTNDKENSD